MEMDVFTIFLKYLLLAASMLMSTADLLMISFGVTVTGSAGYKNFAYITAAVGMILISTGFIGTFASIRESHILSIWFMATGVLSFVGNLIFLIMFACMRDDLFEATKGRIESAWDLRDEEPDMMNKVQSYYMCCGREGPGDYLPDKLPLSCCLDSKCDSEKNIFTGGCYEDAIETFQTRSDVLVYSLVASLLFVGIGTVVTYFFAKKLSEQRKKDLAEIALNENQAS